MVRGTPAALEPTVTMLAGAAPGHPASDRPAGVEHPRGVDGEGGRPVLVGGLHGEGRAQDPGDVDQDVDRADRALHALDLGVDGGGVGDVQQAEPGAVGPPVGGHDVGAALGEQAGDRGADALGRAGDERDAPVEPRGAVGAGRGPDSRVGGGRSGDVHGGSRHERSPGAGRSVEWAERNSSVRLA